MEQLKFGKCLLPLNSKSFIMTVILSVVYADMKRKMEDVLE
jgi:hypothetical protein